MSLRDETVDAALVLASEDVLQLMNAIRCQIADDVHKIEFNQSLYAVNH